MGATDVSLAYQPVGSAVHRLNPFVMLSWLASLAIASLAIQHPVWLLLVFLSTIPVALAAGVATEWRRVMRFVLWMMIAIVVINAVIGGHGEHVLLIAGFRLPLVGSPRLTLEALAFGGSMGLRLAAIISGFALLNLCVHPDNLLRAAIKLRLPYRFVLTTSLSIRFVPVLLQDAATISDVQQSRGLSYDSGGLTQRIRSRGALVLPLLSNALDRAVQVAEAMESRAYGAARRCTFYRDEPLRPYEVVLLLVLWVGIALSAWSAVAGIGRYSYYPSLSPLSMSANDWLMLVAITATLCSVAVVGVFLPRRLDD